MGSGVTEAQAAAGDEISHRPGHEHLSGPGLCGHARGDRDGEPVHVVDVELHLTGMEAGSDRDSEACDGTREGKAAADGPGRPVEGREVTVTGSLESPPPVAADMAVGDLVVLTPDAFSGGPRSPPNARSSRRCR